MPELNDPSYLTHQPLIKAVLDTYNPDFILEMGIGYFSTPLFADRNYLGIENDGVWIEAMMQEYPGLKILKHEYSNIHHFTRLKELEQFQINDIIAFYKTIKLPPSTRSLLFVDNYSCCRSLAINSLQDKFNIIIFHDCEPASFVVNAYDTVKQSNKRLFYLTSTTNWTGLLVDSYNPELETSLQKHIKDFISKYLNFSMSFYEDSRRNDLLQPPVPAQ